MHSEIVLRLSLCHTHGRKLRIVREHARREQGFAYRSKLLVLLLLRREGQLAAGQCAGELSHVLFILNLPLTQRLLKLRVVHGVVDLPLLEAHKLGQIGLRQGE